jgi:hypothetical protein
MDDTKEILWRRAWIAKYDKIMGATPQDIFRIAWEIGYQNCSDELKAKPKYQFEHPPYRDPMSGDVEE